MAVQEKRNQAKMAEILVRTLSIGTWTWLANREREWSRCGEVSFGEKKYGLEQLPHLKVCFNGVTTCN